MNTIGDHAMAMACYYAHAASVCADGNDEKVDHEAALRYAAVSQAWAGIASTAWRGVDHTGVIARAMAGQRPELSE